MSSSVARPTTSSWSRTDASGDLAYAVAYEHTTATVNGVRSTYSLRVTHVYGREDGERKVVHRHGDPIPVPPNDV